MRPKKSLGQHWLHDGQSLDKIINAAEIDQTDVVLEIGPGLGSLTAKLADVAKKVIAVEFDKDLADRLPDRLLRQNVEVVHQDIRRYDLSDLPRGYKVVANIPYYLTSHLVRQLLEATNPPVKIVLLVQKEVAERITARPGNMSVLSVCSQYYADCVLGDVIPAELFEPPPKVDSQVVILNPLSKESSGSGQLFRVVKAGFGERRKKLINSLAGGLQIDKDLIKQIINKLGLDDNVRAQELTIKQWELLTELINEND